MSSLTKLKAAKSLDDIAALVGFKASALSYILYKLPESKKYTEFEIPKRSGGVRKIKAPDMRLRLLQRRLANIFYQCLAEIDKTGKRRKPLSHGFAKTLSIITNAAVHKRRRYVLNLDLKDFFPSINFGRVRGVLIKDKRFELEVNAATVIAQVACHDNSLPQGSPCSPVLSNIVAHILDIRLVRLASESKCTYSRYADDITFSTNRARFPIELAAPAEGSQGNWKIGNDLLAEIKKCGFEINESKTRMQVRGSRQLTTGLLVNEKVNIRPEYYRTVRSMCSSLFNTGSYFRMIPATLHGGKLGEPEVKDISMSLALLQGRLEHIYHVRNSVDRRESAEKKKHPTATRRLYHRFLFYKNFAALDRPLIIAEGKTDVIYLRSAIEKLSTFHPKLGSIENGKLKTVVQFMKYTRTVHDVLQLGGGTGDFKFFMLWYKGFLSKFKHRPLSHPVVLLIDNDDGAKEIFSVSKELGVMHLSYKSKDLFYRFYGNLYLVKSLEMVNSNEKSCIEDLFDPAVKAIELDGKKFDPNKKNNEPKKYGKALFAEKVIRPNVATIEFNNFGPLLDRIVAVIDDYAKNGPCNP